MSSIINAGAESRFNSGGTGSGASSCTDDATLTVHSLPYVTGEAMEPQRLSAATLPTYGSVAGCLLHRITCRLSAADLQAYCVQRGDVLCVCTLRV
jgi:hypothetical protein